MENKDNLELVAVNKLVANRYQPRDKFNDETIGELAESIKTHGVIQPIVVRSLKNGIYEIIAGERRFRAAKTAGLKKVPVVIKKMDEQESATVAIIENIQRENLTAIEEARAYKNLMDLHELTQEKLASQVGKSQSTIANKIRLLSLSSKVQDAILNRQITERHARELLKIKKDEELQIAIMEQVINGKLSVKETEKLVKKTLNPSSDVVESGVTDVPPVNVPKQMNIVYNTYNQTTDMIKKMIKKDVKTQYSENKEEYVITLRISK